MIGFPVILPARIMPILGIMAILQKNPAAAVFIRQYSAPRALKCSVPARKRPESIDSLDYAETWRLCRRAGMFF
jgi:hypothetical protein